MEIILINKIIKMNLTILMLKKLNLVYGKFVMDMFQYLNLKI